MQLDPTKFIRLVKTTFEAFLEVHEIVMPSACIDEERTWDFANAKQHKKWMMATLEPFDILPRVTALMNYSLKIIVKKNREVRGKALLVVEKRDMQQHKLAINVEPHIVMDSQNVPPNKHIW